MRWLLLLGLALVWSGVAEAQGAPRRLALLVGSNDGGPRRSLLRYAQADAESMARVLVELGGVAPSDQFLLRDPDAEALDQAWEQLQIRVEEAGADGAEVVFYYSGHSDHHGLLLGGQTYAYDGLRATLEGLPARVRVGILDSCASGAMVRGKGGRHLSPLMGDLSSDVRGYALLTSASADEEAQESDLLGGSFFTQALVTGLRGAADHSGDGRITLAEAYTFAYEATLADTERTSYGPQHPAYDMSLQGSGELVLTDVREVGATLVFAAGMAERASVRDTAGRLVAELRPASAQDLSIALVPGAYVVTLGRGEQWADLKLEVAEGETIEVDADSLTWRTGSPTRPRGSSRFLHWPVRVNTLATRADPHVVDHVAFNLLFGRCAYLHGVAVGVGGTLVDRDANGLLLAVGTNLVGDDASGLHVAGGLNRSQDNVRAWQIAGGVNLVGGYARGFLLAPGLNYVGGPAAGLQIAGGVNWVTEYLAGIQLGGGLNRATTLYGVQVGLVNLAQRSYGIQVGVVNRARQAYGLQLGLVNLGQEGHVSIGALNLFRHGRHHLYLVATTREPVAIEVQLGGEVLFNVLGIGLTADGRVSGRWGLGGIVPLGARDRLEPAVVGAWTGSRDSGLLLQGRVVWGHSLSGLAELFLGPSWDVWVPVAEGTGAPGWGPVDHGGAPGRSTHGPGAVAGVGLSF